VLRGLADGVPPVPHARLLNWLADWPMILASAWVRDPRLLVAIHGLGHVLLPIGALVASWRLLRPDRLDLLPLPLLGICVVALPGIAFLISEAIIVAILGWPLVLAVARGRARRHRWWVTATVIVVAVSHPVGVGILGLAAVAAVVAEPAAPAGRPDRGLVALLLLVTVVTAIRYVAFADPYELDAVTLDRLWVQVRGTVLRAPGIAVGAGLAAAALVTAAGRWPRGHGPSARRPALVAALVLTLVAAAVLVPWAGDLVAWGPALRYRGLVALVTAPALLLAVVALRQPAAPGSASTGRVTGWIGLAAATSLAVVLTIQGLAWRTGLDRAAAAAGRAGGSCVAAETIGIPRGSALDHWGLTSMLLVWDGPTPGRLVLPAGLCPDRALSPDGGLVVKAVDGAPVDVVVPGRARWWSFGDLLEGLRGS
jgi:hypothetical protein